MGCRTSSPCWTASGHSIATEDQLAQSEQTVAANLIALYKALGGGWELLPQPPGEHGKPRVLVAKASVRVPVWARGGADGYSMRSLDSAC